MPHPSIPGEDYSLLNLQLSILALKECEDAGTGDDSQKHPELPANNGDDSQRLRAEDRLAPDEIERQFRRLIIDQKSPKIRHASSSLWAYFREYMTERIEEMNGLSTESNPNQDDPGDDATVEDYSLLES